MMKLEVKTSFSMKMTAVAILIVFACVGCAASGSGLNGYRDRLSDTLEAKEVKR